MNYFAAAGLLWLSVVGISSYETYSPLHSIVFTNIPEPEDNEHSEYFFGKCATDDKRLLARDTLVYENIKGQIIVRGHLNLTREMVPNCVHIKATSDIGDMVRYNSYKFTVCLIQLIYTYSGERFDYFYYEWFIPVQMQKAVTWDLYFYEAEIER